MKHAANNKRFLASFFIAIFSTTSNPTLLNASPYSFGGACQSQGSWTAAALSQAESIKRIIHQLKDNENCKGIESVLLSLDGAMRQLDNATDLKNSEEYQSIPKDMEAMREVVSSEEDENGRALESIFNMSLNMTKFGSIKKLREGTSRAGDVGLRMLDETLNILPSFNQCLDSTDQGIALLGASLHLTNAFLQSGEGVVSRLGNTLSKFVTFLRNGRYAKRLRDLNEVEYMASISCLMETTADTYCSVANAYELLEMSKNDLEKLEAQRKKIKENQEAETTVPLEGYFLMVREVPIVTEWLQSVLYGVEPRTPHDAKFKETVQDNVNDFVKSRYSIMGIYNYELTLLTGLTDPDAKKNHVVELLNKLLYAMTQGGGGSGNINFYFKTMRQELIPFYLIGRNSIPGRVIPTDGTVPVRWTDFMRNLGPNDGFIPEFDDPEQLTLLIGERLRSLMDQSLVSASDYFRQQLIIDLGNLVARSVTSQTFSVFESLSNIRSYLDRMYKEIMNGHGEKIIVSNLDDTIAKIDAVLDVYAESKQVILAYQELIVSGADKETVREEIRNNKQLKDAYERIISNVYLGFNMLYQRETFLTTRLRTFVSADYAYKTRNQEDLSDQQRLLLTLSGRNLIERFMASHDKAPDLVALDLAQAQVINTNNMNVTGRLFDDAMYNMILKLKLIEEGKYSKMNMKLATLNHLLNHSQSGWNKLGVIFSPTLYYNFLFNRPRYSAPSLFDFEHPSLKDDKNGSYAKMRSKLCTQSLMLHNRELFNSICKETVLWSKYMTTKTDTRIKVDYDESLNKVLRAQQKARWNKTKDDLQYEADVKNEIICAYDNYKKKNRAYWLLKNLRNEE